jgi:G3E family GTPase
LPFTVLTGYLGSGKTTLLNQLLTHPSLSDTAVVVNEFGEIGIDHLLVSSVADDVVLLHSGCICCSVGDDLGPALASLLARRAAGELPPFRRIILETTGIADPGSVLQRIISDGSLATRLRIDSVVTVVDSVFGALTLGRHPECASQVAVATRLVISKFDLIDTGQLDHLIANLRAINPGAPIVTIGRDCLVPDELFADAGRSNGAIGFGPSPPKALHVPHAHAGQAHAERYATFCMGWAEPVEWEEFKDWLESLLIARGDSILRLKGLLHVCGVARPVIVQGVQQALYPPTELAHWPDGTAKTEIVFVTRDFSVQAARRSIQQFFPHLALS